MPLVERFNDWNITDQSHDDPHTLAFDHRIEASAARNGSGLADVENNVRATCVVTVLQPEFGWTQVGNNWIYDPKNKDTDLMSIWRNNLPGCVQHDKKSLKDVFCNVATNPTTAYVGPEARVVSDNIDALEWPMDATDFISRFPPASQYMIGPKYCSAYHIGDGYMGTAGHCLDKALEYGELTDLRAVFNWIGDVGSQKLFTESEVFKIDRVVLCDTHGPAPSPNESAEAARWSRRWDSAISRLMGTPAQLSHLRSVKYASEPPKSGTPIYNIGCSLGTQLKVSRNGHLLRHSLVGDEDNPFSHQVTSHGSFTTDLDQFKGNSGGPVFDADTGHIVGHTSSTQDAVAESNVAAIESWANEKARQSKNYALAAEINCLLQEQEPDNGLYRIHPKFLRTLSARPGNSPLIKCATIICPGDLGPKRVTHAAGMHQAVFSRHAFASKDVYLKNVTARTDRSAIIMSPLDVLLSNNHVCVLAVFFVGQKGTFGKPDASSTLVVGSNAQRGKFQRLEFYKETGLNTPPGTDVWSAIIDLAARRQHIPSPFLKAPHGVLEWTKVRLEQPSRNPPIMLGLRFSCQRSSFPFAVSESWPPGRPDVTQSTANAGLRWPRETFDFATTAGRTCGVPQTGSRSNPAVESRDEEGLWIWEAPIDRVWTNPRQPSYGLRDPMMDDIDELLG